MICVAERAGRQPGQLPGVPVGERDHHPVRGERLQAGQRIGREARLALLAIGDHRRARSLELLDGLAHRCFDDLGMVLGADPARGQIVPGLDQPPRPGDAADGLGGNDHRSHRPVRIVLNCLLPN